PGTPGDDRRATVSGSLGPAHGADLSVTISDNPDPVVVGALLTYTVTVRSNGVETARGVSLTDTLDRNVRFRSATASQGRCSAQKTTVGCALGILGTAHPQPWRSSSGRPRRARSPTRRPSPPSSRSTPTRATTRRARRRRSSRKSAGEGWRAREVEEWIVTRSSRPLDGCHRRRRRVGLKYSVPPEPRN